MLPLKLLIYVAGAGWAALGILVLPKPEALLYFVCAALTMKGMWR